MFENENKDFTEPAVKKNVKFLSQCMKRHMMNFHDRIESSL